MAERLRKCNERTIIISQQAAWGLPFFLSRQHAADSTATLFLMGIINSSLMSTYGRLPLSFKRGKGAWLYTESGDAYLDATTGIAVCGLGHAHPRITQAIQDQAGELLHCSNQYQIPLQAELGSRLCRLSSMDRAFLCNSGAEANEAALRLAQLWAAHRGLDSTRVVVMDGAFHGRTQATLNASDGSQRLPGPETRMKNFLRVPFNDLEAIEQLAATEPDICAVMLEPVQGEAGVIPASQEYLQTLRQLCDRQQWLLIFDEVQSGNGRTGNYFAYQDYGLLPDIVTTAKGLGNGIPIGCCLARGIAATLFRPGDHGSTVGGSPFAARVGLTVVDTIQAEGLCDQAIATGDYLLASLKEELAGREYIIDIRGRGMMLGIELANPCPELALLAGTQGLLINVTAERVIRLLPPLNLSRSEAGLLVKKLCDLIRLYMGDERQTPRQSR